MKSIDSLEVASIRTAAQVRTAALPLEELNPADPQGFVDDTVGYVFERLRREDPVHRSHSPIPGIDTYWSVTRYRDIMQVDTSHDIYSSEGGITLMDFPPGDEQKLPMFIAMDPPKHDEQRKAVGPIVASANLNNWQDLIRERTGKVLDSLPRDETFNWVDKVSIELTTYMLATLFDFPPEDRRLLTHWSDMATSNKLTNPDAPDPEVRMAELHKMLEYFTRLWNERINAGPRARDEEHGTRRVHGKPGIADRWGQRHHAQFNDRRITGLTRESGGNGQAARQSGAGGEPGSRNHPLANAAGLHAAKRAGRYGIGWQADSEGRQTGDVVPVGQPG